MKRIIVLGLVVLGIAGLFAVCGMVSALPAQTAETSIAGPTTVEPGTAATYSVRRETVNGYQWAVSPSASLTPQGASATFQSASTGQFALTCDGDEYQPYGWRGRKQRLVAWRESLSITVARQEPPPPPPPQAGLRFLITGDIREVRDMTPEGVAVLTSRTVRDWMDQACEPGGFLIAPKAFATADPRFSALAAKAPDGRVTAVALAPGKEPIVFDPVPRFDVLLTATAKYAGVAAKPNAARPPPALREFSAAEWATFKGQNGVATVNGIRRFNAAKPRDLKAHPRGQAPGTVSLSAAGVRVIPRSEWPKYLAAQRDANAGLYALLYNKLPSSDQASTNYCWGNGPANCGATLLYVTGRGSYLLSAASVCAPLTGYRNVGGWPADAVEFMTEQGIVRDALWPNAAISRQYAGLPAVKADYPKHVVTSTIADLGVSDIFDETVTCVLLGCPVATAHNWWGHAVMAVGLDFSAGVWYLIERNSWGGEYGDQGFFKLREGHGSNRAGPDDAQVILWLGPQPVGGDGASLKPLTRVTIEVPVSADVCPVEGGCPGGGCGLGFRPRGRRH